MNGEEWFASRGWTAYPFQRETWDAYAAGKSGLIHASTGTGKTYAAFLGPLSQATDERPPLTVLWLTPLRALSNDTAVSLQFAINSFGVPWDVGIRTGDTTPTMRARQKKRLPSVLVTTPESLALFLSHEDARDRFASLRCVIVDEWHELLGTKRGVLTELALARLRRFQPKLQTWGLSATLGNLDIAMSALLGPGHDGVIIQGRVPKTITIDALLPTKIERFPWAGHLGLSLLPQVVAAIDEGKSALCFTNTRSQTEIWYQAILNARPDWAGLIALHHGSLDRKTRDWVEDQLRAGTLRCVVCTSSLDLGVDFSPVDRVIQIGSPKGVARLLQRAGRSGHQPGAISRVTCVPTNTFELIEIAAARAAAEAGAIEARIPIAKPLDVLAQHAITCALAGGFQAEDLLSEVQSTHAYQDLSPGEWHWVLDFITRGGEALKAYPEYRRVVVIDGVYRVEDGRIARRHRMAIGTISADASIQVRFVRGGRLGTVEESFAARLKPRDRFTFAGRILEFVRFHEMTLQVKLTRQPSTMVPRWAGGRMPLSTELAAAVRQQLDDALHGRFSTPEMQAVRTILATQQLWLRLPAREELLIERLETREGFHLFLFPFEGRLVHEGLAALLAYRLSRRKPQSFALAANDYGLELVSPDPFEVDEAALHQVLDPEALLDDALESLNATELAKRQFREVARVAGLVNPGMPHAGHSAKQLQASSALFFNVFREYDPKNLLLWQAQREVLDRQFEFSRLRAALVRLRSSHFLIVDPPRPTPLAFPLLVDRLRDSISSEKLADRVKRMVRDLERHAGPS